ncbi:MAG TPA: phosphoadenylyl-sulfate reductase [Tepidisphaeraceae bacterium]|nr:phosphoadenylyl-sulfate reductase [Tepidisphaeraceae bacterium]
MNAVSTMQATLEDLPALNAMFEKNDAASIVKWSAAQFGPDLLMSSSFGAESAVMLHMVTQVVPNIKIIFVNTGYLFPETHRFMEELRLRLNLNVWIYRTRNDPINYLHEAGEGDPAWRKDVDACCAANKNEPFERAMKEIAPRAWLRGIRRHQNIHRQERHFIEWSPRYNCFAISPILHWTSREIHAYLKRNDLPYHPLVDKGYLSIGCNPLSCTRPVTADDDPRAGRWAGKDKMECGINITKNSLDSANL